MKKFILFFSFLVCCISSNAQSTVHQYLQIFEGIDPGNEMNATYAFKAATYKAVSGPHKFVIVDNPPSIPYGPYTYNVAPIWFNQFKLQGECETLNEILAQHPFGDVTIECSTSADWENLKFIFKEGVTLEAIPCRFSGFDSMLGFNRIQNFSIEGYGATLKGQFEEHAAMFNNNWPCAQEIPPTYPGPGAPMCYNEEDNYYYRCWLGFGAQGRDGIHLMGCENVNIEGISIIDMGSDGINLDPGLNENYGWTHDIPTRNAHIKNCSITNSGRVGLCFCSSANSSVMNSEFDHNGYLVTGYDIDVEPFNSGHSANDILISKCSFNEAKVGAVTLGPNALTNSESDFSAEINDCVASNTGIGFIQVGGKYIPKPKDRVFLSRNAMKKIGNGDLGLAPAYGILYRSRIDCEAGEKDFLWDVNDLVLKEINTESHNSYNLNSYGTQISGRTAIPSQYAGSCSESCEVLEECSESSAKEYFGGIRLRNTIMYDNHAAGERWWERLVVQEKALYCRDNETILNSFKNISTQNVVKVNPQNVEGNKFIMDENSADCDYDETCDFSGSTLETAVFKPRAIIVPISDNTITEGDVLSFKICTQGRRRNTNPIAVDYFVSGNADNRIDYDYITGTTVIPVGKRCVRCDIQTRYDCKNEGDESIILKIHTDADLTYTKGNKPTLNVTLQDYSCGDFAPDSGDSGNAESRSRVEHSIFSFFPNPASSELTVIHDNIENQIIEIISRDGKLLLQKEITGSKTKLDVSNLNSGIYLIGIKNKNSAPNFTKLIISK